MFRAALFYLSTVIVKIDRTKSLLLLSFVYMEAKHSLVFRASLVLISFLVLGASFVFAY